MGKLNPKFSENDFKIRENGLLNHKVITDNVTNLINPEPVEHAKILLKMLKKITPVNFRQLANLGKEVPLTQPMIHVLVVEQVLQVARNNKWNICRTNGFVYIYNGAFWKRLNDEELKVFLGEAAEKLSIGKLLARHYSFRDQLIKQFSTTAFLPKPQPSKNLVLINLKNGTLEISPTGVKLRPFNLKDFLTYQLPFEYDTRAEAPLFIKYLDRVLPDIQRQNILFEIMGYVFISNGRMKLEKALLLFGSGANGKSVFYEVMRKLLGDQNTSEYSLNNLTNENGYYRAMITDKLVNYASEINGKLQAATFKQLVSGEPCEARLPYRDPFIIEDYAKLVFNCNELPKEVEQTHAFFRRFLIIPFDVTIPEKEQDKELPKKIIDTELPGVLNWVLNGLKRILDQKGFSECEASDKALQQYEKESDSVQLFLDEYGYVPHATNSVPIKTLYPDYRVFSVEDGYKPVKNLTFCKRLEKARIAIEKKNVGKVAFLIISKNPA